MAGFPQMQWPAAGADPALASFSSADVSWDQGPSDALTSFIVQWNLNEDAQRKLNQLSPEMQQMVMREFKPAADPTQTNVNGKFIMFATSIEKNKGKGKGSGKGGGKDFGGDGSDFGKGGGVGDESSNGLVWYDPTWGGAYESPGGNEAWEPGWDLPNRKRIAPEEWGGEEIMKAKIAKGAGKPGYQGAWSADIPNPDAENKVLEFCQKWSLNQDALTRLSKCCPATLEAVLRDFNPKGDPKPGTDWSGKLIMFASNVQQNFKFDPLMAFISRWNLGPNAQHKLWTLEQWALDAVMQDFSPPGNAPNVDGMLIMFASSVVNAGIRKGGKGVSPPDTGKGFKGKKKGF